MSDPEKWACNACGNVGLQDGNDGFYYCVRCGARADDIIETGVAEEDFVDKGFDTGGALYLASHSRRRNASTIKAEPLSQPLYDSPNPLFFWNTLTLDAEATPKPQRQIKKEEYFDDGAGPSGPEDFGGSSVKGVGPGFEDYYNEIRIRYVMGVQLMVQFQCEALVREFKVSPLICGLAGTLWMRFVAGTGVFDDDWADQTIQDSELQTPEEAEDHNPRAKYRAEPHNMFGKRAVMIWCRSLRKRIPLSCSLAVSFLACHIVREAILPTDIVKWSLEGKLPYFAAFVEIEKRIGRPSSACPISSNVMFKPSQALSFQKLESLAALVAESIGLDLPPVNFYAIACRYIQKLCLPTEKILPHACRIYEWSMPPDLWLSTNELRLPSRVCVMSILIVAIRILYDIHGFGEWEKSLSSHGGSSPTLDQIGKLDLTCDSDSGKDSVRVSGSPYHNLDDLGPKYNRNSSEVQKSELDAAELLHKLEASYNEIADSYEYSKDLPTYLQYCKDVAFAGLEPSFEDHEEERLIEEFWDFYQKEKDSEPAEPLEERRSSAFNQKRSRNKEWSSHIFNDNKKVRDERCVSSPSADDGTYCADDSPGGWDDGDHSSQSSEGDQNLECKGQASAEILKNEAIRRMKLDMEGNRFLYIPPRVNVKRFDYLHHMRKKDEGAFTYVAHTDYYMLLCACARVAQVDIRIMHVGVLSLERRLAWLESRIDHCLHLTPPIVSCEFCTDVAPEHAADDFRKKTSFGKMLLKLCFSLFLLINLTAVILAADRFSRDDFPPGFVFGSGSSAYQVEGAADQDGRAPSIWDTFTHAGKMHGDNADIACDEYHKYKEDVQLMADTGLEAYRFSISWSRLIPNGRGPVNPKGLQYYNNLINELISNGIQPHVTLHHNDLPQALEDEYGGWVNRKIVKDFTAYADVCFRKLGDRVSHWTTVNEANVFVIGGYDGGYLPPQHCSSRFGVNCTRGNSSTEPYLAAHHILLAHASAAILYKEKYQKF